MTAPFVGPRETTGVVNPELGGEMPIGMTAAHRLAVDIKNRLAGMGVVGVWIDGTDENNLHTMEVMTGDDILEVRVTYARRVGDQRETLPLTG